MINFCVILCRRQDALHQPRFKRFYVESSSADGALLTASDHHPHFRAVGIEPSDLYPSRPLDVRESAWQAA
jgi:hypothetical protein